MKMNRTEWLVVLLCGGALIWMMTRPKPEGEKQTDTAEVKPADSSKPGEPAKPGDAPKPGEPAPTPAPAPEVKEETFVVKNEAAEYTFTNLGGGMREIKLLPAQYAGKTTQILNSKDDDGPLVAIGTLSDGSGSFEKLAYTKESQTDRSISFTATTPEGLKITKKWELEPTPKDKKETDGYGYLWNLTVNLTNTGDKPPEGRQFLYSGMVGRLHTNDWIQPSATWYANGDANEMDASAFDRSTVL